MTAEQTAAAFTIEQVRLTIDRLRESWAWLLELVEPGRGGSGPSGAMTDDQAERLEAVGHSDRAYRAWNLRHGMSALPPSPAAVRLAVIDAQTVVAAAVVEAAHLAASAADAVYVGGRSDRTATVEAALNWLDWHAAKDALAQVRDQQVAAKIDRLLQRADRVARQAARCEDDEVVPLQDRCPACGRRSLQQEVGRDADGRTLRRVIRCISSSCRCTGEASPDSPACGCGQAFKRHGRAHAWTPDLLDGPHGLWAAIAAAPARRRPPVTTGAAGHGGWQSRRTVGQS